MEAWSGARIKAAFGWIIKKIAACWNAIRLWRVALFKNKACLFSFHVRTVWIDGGEKMKERIKTLSLWNDVSSGFSAALCHCPWCWINAAIQRPWNRLLEPHFFLTVHVCTTNFSSWPPAQFAKRPVLFSSHREWWMHRHSPQNSFVIHASERVVFCPSGAFCTQKGLISADGNITSIQGQSSSYWYE